MNKNLILALLMSLSLLTPLSADENKHDLQVFTANTMEVPCSGTPRELYFGEYEEVAKASSEEIKNIVNNGVSQAGSSVSGWLNANGSIDGSSLGANFGAGLIGSFIGTSFKNAVYDSMNDPEYLMISECNSGARYTRLITMVVSDKKLTLSEAKELAKRDQRKMARKVNK